LVHEPHVKRVMLERDPIALCNGISVRSVSEHPAEAGGRDEGVPHLPSWTGEC